MINPAFANGQAVNMVLGPQMTAPGQEAYQEQEMAPGSATTQQEPIIIAPFTFEPMKLTAVSEFIPKGKIALTSKEQFPDLDDAFGEDKPKQKKAKKDKKEPVKKVIEEEVEDDSVPWKGKPSSFFLLNMLPGEATDPANPNNF